MEAIRGAIERSRAALHLDSEMRALRTCHESLTPRECEVMALVVSGLLNKQVGGELGISEITVKAHRGQVMRKMKADSLPDLVTMAAKLSSAKSLTSDTSLRIGWCMAWERGACLPRGPTRALLATRTDADRVVRR